MGRGGYSGGSTIIYPGGRGWSYDPLSPMPGTKGQKGKKKAKAKKPKKRTDERRLSRALFPIVCLLQNFGH